MTREIKEKASNYMTGRAMALSFKPLSLEDIKEAYLCGADEYAHLKESANPWHKVSDGNLPKETILVCARGFLPLPLDWCETLNGWLLAGDLYKQDNIAERWDYWMEIPELPKED